MEEALYSLALGVKRLPRSRGSAEICEDFVKAQDVYGSFPLPCFFVVALFSFHQRIGRNGGTVPQSQYFVLLLLRLDLEGNMSSSSSFFFSIIIFARKTTRRRW